jgi:hypothetical protein
MKKILILLFFVSTSTFGQINLTGDAIYKLNIVGYQGRDPNACGDIDGLKNINVRYFYGNEQTIHNERKINANVDHEVLYTKTNPIVNLQINTTNRWEITSGCNGGPEDNRTNIAINNTCFSYYQQDVPGYLKEFTATSRPYINFNFNGSSLYLDEIEELKVELPDNLDKSHYNWKFQVGTGPVKDIPASFNNTNILKIKGGDFLTSDDYGKQVNVWLETGCNAGEDLARGIARRGAYLQVLNCINGCGIRITCISTCLSNLNNYFNQLFTSELRSKYQSVRSNNIIFFTYLKAAPRITSYKEENSKCYGEKNGSLKIQFDRPILPNETLSINIEPKTSLDPTYDNTPNQNLTSFQAGNTFTVTNIKPGNYNIKLLGYFNRVTPTYSPTTLKPVEFSIKSPNPVAFTTSKTNIWCYGGNDGTITIDATEGTTSSEKPYQYSLDGGATWTFFANGNTTTITNLSLGDYNIKVRDGNECVAKIQKLDGNVISLGEEIVKTETIEQPKNSVIVNYTLLQQPTFYGGTDGKIVVAITGGTILDNNTYNFEWKNSAGVTQTSTNTSFANGIFNITLNNIPSDTYYLSVWDKNYDKATQKEGCGVLNSEQFLDQPKPIVVTLTAKAPSCNATNAFGNETDFNPTDGQRDESQDGMVTAKVTGGIPFTGSANGGKPYIYFWKKQLPNGDWQKIDNPNAILLQVSDGNYALNVEDKNGIRLGTYFENGFIKKDSTLYVKQPDKLEISFVKQDVTCGIYSNGSITANVTGGIPPYNYEWSTTGSNTNTLSGLGAGNYFVRVTDAKKCVVQGSIDLPQPEGIDIAHRSKNPSCNQGSNGSINLIIKDGGRPPFTYEWNTGATTQNLKNLTAGTYTVVVKDSIGCAFVYTVTLKDPEAIVVNLGPDRTLCNEQSHDLDITIDDPDAKYSWTSSNGFSATDAKVSLKEAGIYIGKVINSQGCEAEDTIEIKTTKVSIESEFFVTSQAYLDEEVMLVNTSNPFGEKTQWVIPTDALVVSEEDKFTILKFNTAGTKTISLKQTQGDCYALYSKSITVEDRGTFVNTGITSTPFIKDFIITPNPSNGKFDAVVNLQDQSPVKLRLYSYVGQTAIIQKSGSGQKNYVIDFDVNLPAGTYVLVLETSQQTLIRKVIIF